MERRLSLGQKRNSWVGPDEGGVEGADKLNMRTMTEATTEGGPAASSSGPSAPPPVHLCPSVRNKIEQKAQQQLLWSRRNNKVGVDEGGGGGGVGVVTQVEEGGGGQSPAPRCLPSAKIRSSSGLSQFQEVDFSNQVQQMGNQSAHRHRSGQLRTQSHISDSQGQTESSGVFGGPPPNAEDSTDSSRLTDQTDTDNLSRGGQAGGKGSESEGMQNGRVIQEKEQEVQSRGSAIMKTALFKGTKVAPEKQSDSYQKQQSEGVNKGQSEGGVDVSTNLEKVSDRDVDSYYDQSIGKGIEEKFIQGLGIETDSYAGVPLEGTSGKSNYGDSSTKVHSNASTEARRTVPVPQSLALKDDYSSFHNSYEKDRFSSGASTSKNQASTSSSTTAATDLSSTPGGRTLTTAAKGDNEEGDEDNKPSPARPRHLGQDEQEKPILTPTSLAIYSSIQQQGAPSFGSCILFTTASCTFVITIVLTVAILVMPKTFAQKDEVDGAKVGDTSTMPDTSNVSYVSGASRAPVHAKPMTKVLKVLLTPTTTLASAEEPSEPTAGHTASTKLALMPSTAPPKIMTTTQYISSLLAPSRVSSVPRSLHIRASTSHTGAKIPKFKTKPDEQGISSTPSSLPSTPTSEPSASGVVPAAPSLSFLPSQVHSAFTSSPSKHSLIPTASPAVAYKISPVTLMPSSDGLIPKTPLRSSRELSVSNPVLSASKIIHMAPQQTLIPFIPTPVPSTSNKVTPSVTPTPFKPTSKFSKPNKTNSTNIMPLILITKPPTPIPGPSASTPDPVMPMLHTSTAMQQSPTPNLKSEIPDTFTPTEEPRTPDPEPLARVHETPTPIPEPPITEIATPIAEHSVVHSNDSVATKSATYTAKPPTQTSGTLLTSSVTSELVPVSSRASPVPSTLTKTLTPTQQLTTHTSSPSTTPTSSSFDSTPTVSRAAHNSNQPSTEDPLDGR